MCRAENGTPCRQPSRRTLVPQRPSDGRINPVRCTLSKTTRCHLCVLTARLFGTHTPQLVVRNSNSSKRTVISSSQMDKFDLRRRKKLKNTRADCTTCTARSSLLSSSNIPVDPSQTPPTPRNTSSNLLRKEVEAGGEESTLLPNRTEQNTFTQASSFSGHGVVKTGLNNPSPPTSPGQVDASLSLARFALWRLED